MRSGAISSGRHRLHGLRISTESAELISIFRLINDECTRGPSNPSVSCNGLRQRPFEVYPERATDDIPDRDDQVVFGENVAPPRTWPIATGAGAGQWISAREGWRAKTFGRSKQAHKPFFHVIEFWLETADDRRCAACDVQGSQDFLKGTRALTMSDPTSLRLMRATQIKEPADRRPGGRPSSCRRFAIPIADKPLLDDAGNRRPRTRGGGHCVEFLFQLVGRRDINRS